jgi:hypothetical protein
MRFSKDSRCMHSSRHISTTRQLPIAFVGGNPLLPMNPLLESTIVSSEEKSRYSALHAAIAQRPFSFVSCPAPARQEWTCSSDRG